MIYSISQGKLIHQSSQTRTSFNEFNKVSDYYKEYRKSKLQAIHDLLLQKRKIYSKTKRRAQAIFKRNERQRLYALATSNPKSFWQEIRQLKENKSKQSNVSLQTFYEHVSQVYSGIALV